jgi:hypothetical protein
LNIHLDQDQLGSERTATSPQPSPPKAEREKDGVVCNSPGSWRTFFCLARALGLGTNWEASEWTPLPDPSPSEGGREEDALGRLRFVGSLMVEFEHTLGPGSSGSEYPFP